MNVWLRAMGANVSMGSLILGLVKDYDMITVSAPPVKPLRWYRECTFRKLFVSYLKSLVVENSGTCRSL